jgi:type IV pilus assembly protein PilC
VLGVSKIITTFWHVIIGGIGIAVYIFKEYIKTEKGRYYFDMFKFKFPVFGKLIKKATISRFTRTFGTLIESSVPILTALDIVKGSVGNSAMEIVIDNIRNSVRQGGRVYEQIELSGMFPKMVSKMVNVGENSGSLDKMLMKVSDFYDNEVETEIKGLTSVIEPLMIVVMGIIIGVIVLSVMLPMFDMMKIARR